MDKMSIITIIKFLIKAEEILVKVNWYNDGTILNVTITGKELWKLWHILNDYYNILRTNW